MHGVWVLVGRKRGEGQGLASGSGVEKLGGSKLRHQVSDPRGEGAANASDPRGDGAANAGPGGMRKGRGEAAKGAWRFLWGKGRGERRRRMGRCGERATTPMLMRIVRYGAADAEGGAKAGKVWKGWKCKESETMAGGRSTGWKA
eukprot:350782-Chlamydomonas_euryale.AAC.1